MNDVLRITNLCKQYDGFSLQNVSFAIPGGSIVGFIGPNGAGKTTTIRSILGMALRDSGHIELFGESFDGDEPHLKEQIGIAMDLPYYVDTWTLRDVERAHADFYKNWDSKRYADCLARFALDPRKKVSELSRGMKVKLMISVALSHHAKLLILDEPTSGLDPAARDELCDVLRAFVCDEEHAILFSTHITSDLDKIADYINFIQDGRILFSGEKDLLRENYCMVRGGTEDLTEALRNALLGLRIHSAGFEGMLPTSEHALLHAKLAVESVTLEDIMVHMRKERSDL